MATQSQSNITEIITREVLTRDLKSLGVTEGDNLALAVRLKSIGVVEGGPNTLIDALLDAVGPTGTLMIPTFTKMFRLNAIRRGEVSSVYDPNHTRCNTGFVAEMLRQRPDAVRSLHPSNSIAAIGANAGYLTKSHDARARAYSPYSTLAQLGGKFLGIGTGDHIFGLRHEAQSRAGLLIVPYSLGMRYRDSRGKIQVFTRRDFGGCTTRLVGLVPELRHRGLVGDGTVGNASALLVDAHRSLTQMTTWLLNDPTINLCQDIKCVWCRELERQLNLYDKISNPVWFQKSRVARYILKQINHDRAGEGKLHAAKDVFGGGSKHLS